MNQKFCLKQQEHQLVLRKPKLELDELAKENRKRLVEAPITDFGLQDHNTDTKRTIMKRVYAILLLQKMTLAVSELTLW